MRLRLAAPIAGMVAVLALLGFAGATAQESPSGRPSAGAMGVVDVIRVFEECDQIKDLNQVLREANESLQKEGEARKKALAQKETELAAFSPNSPDYRPRRREVTRMNIDFNVWVQQSRAEMAADHFNWTRVVYDHCCRVTEEIARERGMSIVLQKREFRPEAIEDEDIDKVRQMIHARAVVWADPNADLTEAVIKRMNQQYRDSGGRAKLKPAAKAP